MLALLNWRIWAAIALAVAASHWKAYHLGGQAAELVCSQERASAVTEARDRQDANRDTARAVEVRYVERDRVRVDKAKEIIKEVNHETQNLAACRLDAGDVRVLNAAADALGSASDRPAPGAADHGLPAPASADK